MVLAWQADKTSGQPNAASPAATENTSALVKAQAGGGEIKKEGERGAASPSPAAAGGEGGGDAKNPFVLEVRGFLEVVDVKGPPSLTIKSVAVAG